MCYKIVFIHIHITSSTLRRLWCVNRYIVNNKMMMFSLSMSYIQRLNICLLTYRLLVMMQKYWKRCLIIYWSTCVCMCIYVDCVKNIKKKFSMEVMIIKWIMALYTEAHTNWRRIFIGSNSKITRLWMC